MLENAISEAKALSDWNENNRISLRNKHKDKCQDLWKKWTDLPALKMIRDPETSSEASFASTLTSAHLPPRTTHQYAAMDVPREIIENIPIFDGKPEGTQPVPEHHKLICNHVQHTESEPCNAQIKRKSSRKSSVTQLPKILMWNGQQSTRS